jgi:SAM-dependent methyltransferase
MCPCCRWRFRTFLPFGIDQRSNALCPGCGSLERHRLLWLYLKNRTDLFRRRLRVLHIAPEPMFAKELATNPLLRYSTADLASKSADVKTDITSVAFKENSFDAVLCNHVLEHVEDDRKAMAELRRVLMPGGWAILNSPIDSERPETFEDSSITSPDERERAFGQSDHVRLYGRDYKERLTTAGFDVSIDNYADELDTDTVLECGIKPEPIYFCTKPLPG